VAGFYATLLVERSKFGLNELLGCVPATTSSFRQWRQQARLRHRIPQRAEHWPLYGEFSGPKFHPFQMRDCPRTWVCRRAYRNGDQRAWCSSDRCRHFQLMRWHETALAGSRRI